MLSSKDGLFDRARGRMVGSDQYLTKSFTKESLLKAVATHMRTRRERTSGGRRRRRGATGRNRHRVGTMAIKRILIVDDSPTEHHILNDLLTKAGYEAVASDGEEDAILKAKQVQPDLILMEPSCPG